jgi:hypothetical protein
MPRLPQISFWKQDIYKKEEPPHHEGSSLADNLFADD